MKRPWGRSILHVFRESLPCLHDLGRARKRTEVMLNGDGVPERPEMSSCWDSHTLVSHLDFIPLWERKSLECFTWGNTMDRYIFRNNHCGSCMMNRLQGGKGKKWAQVGGYFSSRCERYCCLKHREVSGGATILWIPNVICK